MATRATLAFHFEDLGKQAHAARLGMWIFLSSELMLFAALFALYAFYRAADPAGFEAGTRHSNLAIGTINTVILITSSFAVAMSVDLTRRSMTRGAAALLVLGVLMGGAFLGLKAVEYSDHIRHGFGPGPLFRPAHPLPGGGGRLFFTTYFLMTGLHALHVLGGMVILAWLAGESWRRSFGPERDEQVPLELGAMYWHLVDLIWIFLWPLFYLLR